MTWPPGIWLCLVTGCLLIALRPQRISRGLCVAGSLLTILGLGSPWISHLWTGTADAAAAWSAGWWAAAVWWLGLGWTSLYRSPQPLKWSPARLGTSILTLTGLLLATQARDWITLILSLELVRRATCPDETRDDADSPAAARQTALPWEATSLFLLGIAAAGQVLVTGAISLDEWRTVLREAYAVRETSLAIGRPSLLLVAATTAILFGVCSPVFWSWRWAPDSATHPGDWTKVLADTTARQLASLLVFRRLLDGGATGLESVCLTVLVLVTAFAWLVAIRLMLSPQRFDRSLTGLLLFQWGCLLLWPCLGLVTRPRTQTPGSVITSLAPDLVWPAALLLFVLTTAASLAAANGLILTRPSGCYWDQFRGRAKTAPGSAALLLIPLCSLIGLPGLGGFWTRVGWLLSLTGVYQRRPDELLIPQAALWQISLLGVVPGTVAALTVLKLARLLLLEPEIGAVTVPRCWWPQALALIAALTLILTGFAPSLLG